MLHVMAGIRCVTPSSSVVPQLRIPKLDKLPSAEEIADMNRVPIAQYDNVPLSGLRKLQLVNVDTQMYFHRDSESQSGYKKLYAIS